MGRSIIAGGGKEEEEEEKEAGTNVEAESDPSVFKIKKESRSYVLEKTCISRLKDRTNMEVIYFSEELSVS
jgi:hypothetical protein